MKTFRLILLASAILSLCCAACNKSDSSITQHAADDTVLSADKLLGKWEGYQAGDDVYDTNGVKIHSWQIRKDEGYFENGAGPVGRNWSPATDISYITFNTDHSFALTDTNGTTKSYMLGQLLPLSGKWNLLSADKIKLTTHLDSDIDTAWTFKLKNDILGLAVTIVDTSTGLSATHRRLLWTMTLKKLH